MPANGRWDLTGLLKGLSVSCKVSRVSLPNNDPELNKYVNT